jgi:hypothetical protein
MTSGGTQVTTVNFLAGAAAQAVVYYRDARAGSWNLSASSFGFSAATTIVQVVPGPYVGIQVLAPGQTADPGRPTTDPSGKLGFPLTETAGSPVSLTLNAVDAYFNAVVSINNPVTLTLTDLAAPAGGIVNLAAGTAGKPVTFYSPANQAVTAMDLVNGKTGVSNKITVGAGTASTLLDVVHASPALSGQGLGAVGVTFLTFRFSVQSGQDPIQLDSLALHARDSNGADVAFNSALRNLALLSGAQTITQSMAAVSSAIATLGTFPLGTFQVPNNSPVTLTLTGDISPNATAKDISLWVDASSSIAAHDPVTAVTPVPVTVIAVAVGDPTGFPMSSGLLMLEPADVAKTFGNYPNPFRPGVENTTLEFYLPAPSTVSLVLYDVLGNKVLTLLNGQNLPSGLQRHSWNGRNGSGAQVLSGVYYAQLTVNGANYLLKVAVVK